MLPLLVPSALAILEVGGIVLMMKNWIVQFFHGSEPDSSGVIIEEKQVWFQ